MTPGVLDFWLLHAWHTNESRQFLADMKGRTLTTVLESTEATHKPAKDLSPPHRFFFFSPPIYLKTDRRNAD